MTTHLGLVSLVLPAAVPVAAAEEKLHRDIWNTSVVPAKP